jgi:hypothetical protein
MFAAVLPFSFCYFEKWNSLHQLCNICQRNFIFASFLSLHNLNTILPNHYENDTINEHLKQFLFFRKDLLL